MSEEKVLQLLQIINSSRGNSEVKLNSTGNALGLTMSQQIALKISKDTGILVNSNLNKGTEFYFYVDNFENNLQNNISFISQYSESQNSKEINLENKINNNEENIIGNDKAFENISLTNEKGSLSISSNSEISEAQSLPQINFFRKTTQNTKKLDFVFCNKEKSNKVLIVDDEPFNLKALEMIINKLNLQCEKAFNGKEAVKLVKEKHESFQKKEKNFKFILMDYQMPEMDGVAATKAINNYLENNAYYKIPIIACTAFSNKTEIELCLKAGMSEVIIKPVSLEKIKGKLEILMKKRLI